MERERDMHVAVREGGVQSMRGGGVKKLLTHKLWRLHTALCCFGYVYETKFEQFIHYNQSVPHQVPAHGIDAASNFFMKQNYDTQS
jgi:hypothetical protein